VPILQLALSSDTLSESDIYNYGLFRIRQQLGPVPGTLLPTPEGGVARQIMVDLDQNALRSKGMTPIDVTAAINAQNVTIPSGTAKIGHRECAVTTNSSPPDPMMLNDVPIRAVDGKMVYMRDVAHVRDGWADQRNVVRANGRPAALLQIMKVGSVSTLDIIKQIKRDVLPLSRAAAPNGLEIRELFDQSIFVNASIKSVLRVAYQETRGHRVELDAQVDSAADAVRLARLRYSGGNTSYLEVLTTDTNLYSAQLLLAQAQQQEAFSIVQLYVALGGGWR
jgi:multidrug efflux pump subunit AcrB